MESNKDMPKNLWELKPGVEHNLRCMQINYKSMLQSLQSIQEQIDFLKVMFETGIDYIERTIEEEVNNE